LHFISPVRYGFVPINKTGADKQVEERERREGVPYYLFL